VAFRSLSTWLGISLGCSSSLAARFSAIKMILIWRPLISAPDHRSTSLSKVSLYAGKIFMCLVKSVQILSIVAAKIAEAHRVANVGLERFVYTAYKISCQNQDSFVVFQLAKEYWIPRQLLLLLITVAVILPDIRELWSILSNVLFSKTISALSINWIAFQSSPLMKICSRACPLSVTCNSAQVDLQQWPLCKFRELWQSTKGIYQSLANCFWHYWKDKPSCPLQVGHATAEQSLDLGLR
jgi:hypothetical protein